MRVAFPLLVLLTIGVSSAVTVPYENWETRQDGTWQGGSGACILREEAHDQVFPILTDQDSARKFAARLQQALFGQKLGSVVTQPVERPGQWGVLASYLYEENGARYRVMQLFLSANGKLRTFTGSARENEFNQCVHDMQSFVRYLAN